MELSEEEKECARSLANTLQGLIYNTHGITEQVSMDFLSLKKTFMLPLNVEE
jgi:hypothetical protein